WNQSLAGDAWSLVAFIPAVGQARFYAGIWTQGVFRSTDPTVGWQNLSALGIGLPAHTAASAAEPDGNFNGVLVDYCRLSPDRVYAWFFKQSCTPGCAQVTAGLYTTSAPTTAWSAVAMVSPPGPAYGFYGMSFALAPNSPGNRT